MVVQVCRGPWGFLWWCFRLYNSIIIWVPSDWIELMVLQVENRFALDNFEEIAIEADAVLLSRGNLGLDVPPERVALVQKEAISRCNLLGKPVIITRVVDSMSQAPRCTRSIASLVSSCFSTSCIIAADLHPVTQACDLAHRVYCEFSDLVWSLKLILLIGQRRRMLQTQSLME